MPTLYMRVANISGRSSNEADIDTLNEILNLLVRLEDLLADDVYEDLFEDLNVPNDLEMYSYPVLPAAVSLLER